MAIEIGIGNGQLAMVMGKLTFDIVTKIHAIIRSAGARKG
jgi:hypothetical protein